MLRQNGRREKAVASAADAALAVAELAPPYASLVRPVLCFAQEGELAGWVRDVMICSTSHVVGMLSTRPPVLVPSRVQEVARRFELQMRSATEPQPMTQGRGVTGAATLPTRPAQPWAGTVTRTGKPAAGTRASVGRGRPRRGRSPQLGRTVVGIVAALGLVTLTPTVLPPAAEGFSRWFVGQFDSAADTEPCVRAERQRTSDPRADRRSASDERTQRQPGGEQETRPTSPRKSGRCG